MIKNIEPSWIRSLQKKKQDYSNHRHTGKNAERSDLINKVSASFLGTPYQGETLISFPNRDEMLVVNFNGVDYFAFIDYVEALTRATNRKTFLNSFAKTRYVKENVTLFNRKHFFSDWFATFPRNAMDVTQAVSPDAITVTRQLNSKADGEYIPGLGIPSRKISYIPASAINEQVIGNLKSSDYIGVYSDLQGPDVTHVGIVIKENGKVWYRNASSLSGNIKVIDTPFTVFMSNKPGIIVLHAKQTLLMVCCTLVRSLINRKSLK